MSGNAKQRTALTNLNEPQQMRELNRQLSWIWDQLLGGLSMKSMNTETRYVIDSKASSEEVDELGNRVNAQQTQIRQNSNEILMLAGQTIGGTNYLLDSARTVSDSLEIREVYRMSEELRPEKGEEFTVRIWGIPGDEDAEFLIEYTDGGILTYVQILTDNGDGTWSSTFNWRCGSIQSITVSTYQRSTPDSETIIRVDRIKLERGGRATDWSPHPEELIAGSVVRITKDEVDIATPRFEVNIQEEDGETNALMINESGAAFISCRAPNITPRYDGPTEISVDSAATDEQIAAGGYYRSLRDAAAALNGRWIDQNVVIQLASGMTEYGEITLTGMSGGGSIGMYGDPNEFPRLIGGMRLSAIPFQVNLFGICIETAGEGIYAVGCPVVDMAMCRVTGPGTDAAGTRCVVAGRGSTITIRATELYDCERSLYGENGGVIAGYACKGNCRVGVSRTTMYLDGTMPCDSAAWTTDIHVGQIIEQNVTVDQGTPPESGDQAAGEPVTAAFDYANSDSYRGGWGWFSDNDIRQGYDGKPIYGVIWFDAEEIRSRLGGKSIKQASLRLHMRTGVGRGVAADVQMYGSDVSEVRTDAPELITAYGTVGKTNPGEVNEITIPVQAIEDFLRSENPICALVLKSDDASFYNDRKYSRNYARFSGRTSADETNQPRLTVVYE